MCERILWGEMRKTKRYASSYGISVSSHAESGVVEIITCGIKWSLVPGRLKPDKTGRNLKRKRGQTAAKSSSRCHLFRLLAVSLSQSIRLFAYLDDCMGWGLCLASWEIHPVFFWDMPHRMGWWSQDTLAFYGPDPIIFSFQYRLPRPALRSADLSLL